MEEPSRSILDSSQFRVDNEINNLISSAQDAAASFSALLDLPPSEAAHLLYVDNAGGFFFPADGGLIDRAARFSVFSSGGGGGTNSSSPETTSDFVAVKCEPPETTDSLNNQSGPLVSDPLAQYGAHLNQRPAKRKEREKKVNNNNNNNNNNGAKKKSKSGGGKESLEEAEKLPYVHVRARRGQATDSHSLAERARREKINARMKLLQELVPGCNKISGTALVLDEIINHVQSLQQQVESLSMRLAAVNPRIDFNLDSLFAAENGSLVESNFSSMIMPMMMPEVQFNGNRQHYQSQWPFDPLHQPVWVREEESPNFITPENSLLSYDSGNSVKMEL